MPYQPQVKRVIKYKETKADQIIKRMGTYRGRDKVGEQQSFEKVTDSEKLVEIKKELRKIEILLNEDYTDTYEDSEIRLEGILYFIEKYRPEALEDVFEYNAKQNLNGQWDVIEHKENTDKRDLYKKRTRMSLSQIVKQIHGRMSFYNIYTLIDDIEANKIKIRKVKYHTRLHRDEIEELNGTIKKQDSVIQDQTDEIKRLNQAFDERLKKLEKKVTVMKNIKKQELQAQLNLIKQ